MAGRIRSLKPEVLDFEAGAGLSDLAWRLWIACWCLADDHGNLRAGARYLAANILQDTGRTADVETALVELGRGRRGQPSALELYQVDGQPFAHIVGWDQPGHVAYQRIANPSAARVPGPDAAGADPMIPKASTPFRGSPPTSSALLPEDSPHARAQRSPISDLRSRSPIADHRSPEGPSPSSAGAQADQAGGEGEGDPWGLTPPGADAEAPIAARSTAAPRARRGRAAPRAPLQAAELSGLERAVHDAILGDPSLAPICRDVPQLARDLLVSAPKVDVLGEVRSLGVWLRANPSRAKTNGNAFLVRNIGRKQREAAGEGPAAGAASPAPAPAAAPPAVPPPRKEILEGAAALAGRKPGALGDLFKGVGRAAKGEVEQ
jgi:hypothetical protein